MEDKDQKLGELLYQWDEVVLKPWDTSLSERLSGLELSSLHACIPDCFESFYKIYYEILPELIQTSPTDYDKLHDLIYDLGGLAGELEHIKNHITAAQQGFIAFLRLVAEKETSG